MKKILSIIAVLLCATACIYPYQPDLGETPEGIIVVDGNLMIGETSTVQIGTMYPLWPDKNKTDVEESGNVIYYAGNPYYYGGLVAERVWAEDDAGDVYEGELTSGGWESGWYYMMTTYTLHTENATANRQYRVCVQADGRLYTSDWIKPLAAPVIKKITFKSDKANVMVNVSLDSGPDATGYVLFTFDETWRFHADWYPDFDYDPYSNSVSQRYFAWDHYWCWKSVNSQVQVPVDYTGMSTSSLKDYPVHTFSRYDNRNHQRYSILVKARTIDKETYKFLSHLEESTESGDNLFTPNPGEVAGNLRCETDPDRMVLGYVTVAFTSSMRAYNDSRFLLSRPNSPYDLAYPKQYPDRPGVPAWPDYYKMGYMPLIENNLNDEDDTKGPYGWGWAACYDCVAAGGTLTAPDFWEY